jgi:hypothetical protein
MKLGLRYDPTIHQPIKAVFLRGKNVKEWLLQIDSWNINLADIECFVMPSSIQNIEAAGLFVLFKQADAAKHLLLLDAYTCIDDKLFIPVGSMLNMQVSKEETNSLFPWYVQVFHPTIGLVGFEKENKLDLEDLLYYPNAIDKDWTFANAGLLPAPAFSRIEVVQPTAEQLMESIKEEIGQKPLGDIPKDESNKTSALDNAIDKVKYGLFKGISSSITTITKLLPESSGSSNSSGPANEGLLQQLQNWLLQNMDQLEKKRNDEISRLLNLFNENTDEALQYAIPLNSPYLNRGSQTLSSKLSRRNTGFNLRGLGGGNVVDGWDLGARYQDLRTKYMNAAQKAIDQKDFKKAAYVYAHLLGDYHNAANVLMQGNMHRDAAALYKDHLKNIPAAAECLEKGGLYHEAIELYKQLDKTEKVGDLYKTMQQDDKAGTYYEQHVQKQLTNNDYLDASRVINEKMQQEERAEQVLLDGWGSSYQHDACLKKYFDIALSKEEEPIEQKVKNVLNKHTPSYRKMAFLHVLEHVNNKKKEEAFAAVAQEIAYEIVHEETVAGNLQALHSLKIFAPRDKLIASDTSRYLSRKLQPNKPAANNDFQLDESIKWLKALWHRNQFLVIGIKNNVLHMARCNWYKNIEYYSWTNEIGHYAQFNMVNAAYHSNHIIIHSSDGLPITRKNLPKNKYFTEQLVVNCPIWLHKNTANFIVEDEDTITLLELLDGKMAIHYYSLDGKLKKSVNCTMEGEGSIVGSYKSIPLTIYRNQYYYTYINKAFFVISKEGKVKEYSFDTIIRLFSTTLEPTEFYLVISTNKGCILYRPDGYLMVALSGIFAQEITPSIIRFIGHRFFIMVEHKTAFLFEIINERPLLVREVKTNNFIVAAMPGPTNLYFVLVEENGKVSDHAFYYSP